jgi:DNA-binding NarL/FixJ family response regulator
MDVGMPQIDGIEATRLTAYGDQTRIRDAQQAGAAGYLLKHSPAEEVVRAVRAACTA